MERQEVPTVHHRVEVLDVAGLAVQ